MTIRKGVKADFQEVFPLFEGFGHLQPVGIRERFEFVINHADHCIFVAELDQKLVGYAWVQRYGPRLRSGEESARLHDLFTLPTHRQQGIGKALLEATKNWCKVGGVHYLEWQSSKQAIAFYEKLGLKGDPYPQPEYPFFEIDFRTL